MELESTTYCQNLTWRTPFISAFTAAEIRQKCHQKYKPIYGNRIYDLERSIHKSSTSRHFVEFFEKTLHRHRIRARSETQISRDQTDHVTSKTQTRIRRHNHHIPHTLINHSHLRFIRRELLREHFSPHNHQKWEHNPSLLSPCKS